MKKHFTLLLIAISLFVSFGLWSKTVVMKNQSASIETFASPTPLAEIENLETDKTEALYACYCGEFTPRFPNSCGTNENGEIKKDNLLITVKTVVRNPKSTPLIYEYAVSGGRIFGQGNQIVWNLEGVRPGTYQITALIKGKRGTSTQTKTKTVTVRECNCHCPCVCPMLTIMGKETVRASESLIFPAKVEGGSDTSGLTYQWTVSQGEIIKGQGTPVIKVKTTKEMSGTIDATVEVSSPGLCDNCRTLTKYKFVTIIK